ncbi:Aste57867_12520 [Aphanomyces stellatus]|uniref:Aste57867_12520 protein n=1 Tax=Aphanomyces stellatus TaxID=120398 RepID=A0A485KVU5_9STRA|nr:hypothetical protein As57867_012474 [Aphanomyces stellatus]VFT89371.1 Aste57867_12520 [Aphanomyces stellatus]
MPKKQSRNPDKTLYSYKYALIQFYHTIGRFFPPALASGIPHKNASPSPATMLHYGPVKKQIKLRSNQLVKFVKPIVHYGFVPLVIYLGLSTEPQADLLMVFLPWVQPEAAADAGGF